MEDRDSRKRPLEIVEVGIIVRNIETTIEKLNSLWKVGPFDIHVSDIPDAIVHGRKAHSRARLAFAQVGPIMLELIEPEEGDNVYWEFLRDRGEGFHHLKIPTHDFENELSFFKEKGIDVLQSSVNKRRSYAYLDTEGVAGVIMELFQKKEG